MSVQLRPATIDDAELIVRLHRAAVMGVGGSIYTAEQLEAWSPPVDAQRIATMRGRLDDSGEVFVVAEAGGRAVGFGSAFPARGWIQNVHVDPAAGGRGVGGAILAHLEGLAQAGGAAELGLEGSLNAEPFYARRGYEVVELRLKATRGVKVPCKLMRKVLARPSEP